MAAIFERALWAAVIVIAVLVLFLLIVPGYADRSAQESSQAFCNSVVIGEDVQSVHHRAKEAGIDLATWAPKDGVVHHQAMFHGISLNAYTCDINARNGVVISKGTEAWTG